VYLGYAKRNVLAQRRGNPAEVAAVMRKKRKIAVIAQAKLDQLAGDADSAKQEDRVDACLRYGCQILVAQRYGDFSAVEMNPCTLLCNIKACHMRRPPATNPSPNNPLTNGVRFPQLSTNFVRQITNLAPTAEIYCNLPHIRTLVKPDGNFFDLDFAVRRSVTKSTLKATKFRLSDRRFWAEFALFEREMLPKPKSLTRFKVQADVDLSPSECRVPPQMEVRQSAQDR